MSKDVKKTLEHCINNECVDCPNNEELGSGETVCHARLLPEILEYIFDLQHRLDVTEKALELACGELRCLNYRTFDNADINFEQQFKVQVESELKGELVMEEKERYDRHSYYPQRYIDNETNKIINIKDTLNRQDKEIKQLKQSQKQLAICELKKLNIEISNNSYYSDETDDAIIDMYKINILIENAITELGGDNGKINT